LAKDIRQLHSSEYRNPSQLRDGDVLVVGAGHSGAEIALEVAGGHRTFLSGRNVGQVPFDIEGAFARYFLIHAVLLPLSQFLLTTSTPIGRKAKPRLLTRSGPLVRTKRSHLAQAGVEFVPKITGAREGRPAMENGRIVDVANVIWCTGFQS